MLTSCIRLHGVVGMITGELGIGKTATLRHLIPPINPHRYKVIYQSETDFGRIDIYRALAQPLGVEPCYRYGSLTRHKICSLNFSVIIRHS